MVGWAVLVAGVFVWGYVLRRSGQEDQDALPPLYATPRLLTWQMLPAVAVAAALVAALPALARRLRWRWLLLTGWVASAGWAVALAVSDGISALAGPLTSPNEYLAGLPAVRRDPLEWVRTFTERLQSYPVHTKGHPPLPMLFLWALDALGMRGAGWAAAAVIVIGSSAVMAIAITLRALAAKTGQGEELARRALPYLVLAPLALWIATAMDAMFLGVGAWGVALLALAAGHDHRPTTTSDRHFTATSGPDSHHATRAGHDPYLAATAGHDRRSTAAARRGRPDAAIVTALAAGLLLGALPYLSYGLLPLFAIPLAIILVTRPSRAVLTALTCGFLVVPVVFTAAGFWWPDGVAATHQAYEAAGGSSRRPYLYFLVGDLGVLALLVGPAVAHALPDLIRGARDRYRVLTWLCGAALLGMLVLDVSGVTRGEVERIWVPYAAWLVTAAAVHRTPGRGWLAAQAATAITVQALVLSAW